MPVRPMLLLAMVVAVALAIAGCGGDDASGGDDGGGSDSASTEVTTSSLTKAQFLKQADDACKAERAELLPQVTAYSEENGSAPEEGTPEYMDLVEAAMLPNFEAEVAAVQALGAPAGEEKEVEAILTAQQEAIDEVAEQGVESYEEIEEIFADASRMFWDYNLSGCSIGQPAPSNG